jgi:Mrp family chromosome partitioning ATPase
MHIKFLRRRRNVALDALGGTPDGALVIVDEDGTHLHVTPPKIASSLRFLLNRLQQPGTDGLPARVAITSALRGEGVSYTSRSLGAVIAYDLERTVAIVDLNWRDPPSENKSKEQQDTRRTLAEAVELGLDVTEIIRPTGNPRLSLVAPGIVARARRPVIAASRTLEDVVDKLAQHFDHVLFDVPPVLAHSDTMSLTHLADGVVLVVRQGITSSAQVEAAIAELGGRELLGVVLNRADSSIPPRLRKMVGG